MNSPFWVVLLLVASATAAPARKPPVQRARAQYRALEQGGERLVLEGAAETAVPGRDGWVLYVETAPSGGVRVEHHGRPVAQWTNTRLRAEWLPQSQLSPAQWSERDLWYELRDLRATPVGWLGVITWHYEDLSGQPIESEYLLRVSTGAHPRLEALRELSFSRPDALHYEPSPRLLPYAGKLLLWEPAEISEIDRYGRRLRRYLQLPRAGQSRGLEPRTVVMGRWIICAPDPYVAGEEYQLDVLDLQRRSLRPLVRRKYDTVVILGASKIRPLLVLRSYRTGSVPLIVTVPGGVTREIATPWAEQVQQFWHDYLVVVRDETYEVELYDVGTLKLAVRYACPEVARPAREP